MYNVNLQKTDIQLVFPIFKKNKKTTKSMMFHLYVAFIMSLEYGIQNFYFRNLFCYVKYKCIKTDSLSFPYLWAYSMKALYIQAGVIVSYLNYLN